MEMQEEAYGFKKEFDYEGIHYSMHVVPFIMATEEDRKAYFLQEGQFLVHLSNGYSVASFAVFYSDDEPVWESNVSKIILDDEFLVERIGFLIDDYYA